MKLQHPVTGFVRDVTDDRRVQILRSRGFVEVDDDTPLGANIPPHGTTGPLQRDDTSTAIPNDAVTPVTPTPDTPDEQEPPAKSAPKADWVAYAKAQGIEDADELNKADLIDRLG